MAVKTLSIFLLLTILSSILLATFAENVCATTFMGWDVAEGPYGQWTYGGKYSEADGILTLIGDERAAGPTLFRQISPEEDFEISLQVKAETLSAVGGSLSGGSGEGFRLMLQDSGINPTAGINFELRGRNGGEFWMAWHNSRCDLYGWQCDIVPFVSNNIPPATLDRLSSPQNTSELIVRPGAWYTMRLVVRKSPYTMTGEVYDENGTLLGSLMIDDITNFGFEEIKVVEISTLCGGTFHVKNFSDIGPSLEGEEQTQVSIFPEVLSPTLGSPVNIRGRLSDLNGNALVNEVVVLWYTFEGLREWLPISSSYTNTEGEYVIQWLNSASGNFTLKAGWSGNSTHLGSSNTTTLSVLPYQDQTVFFVESNSTVTALAFDTASSELEFSVTGPSGTDGFVRVTLAKSLVANGADLAVYLDGNQLDYSVTSQGDSWLVAFSYAHSKHRVVVHLPSGVGQDNLDLRWLIPSLVVVVLVAGLLIYLKKHKHLTTKFPEDQT